MMKYDQKLSPSSRNKQSAGFPSTRPDLNLSHFFNFFGNFGNFSKRGKNLKKNFFTEISKYRLPDLVPTCTVQKWSNMIRNYLPVAGISIRTVSRPPGQIWIWVIFCCFFCNFSTNVENKFVCWPDRPKNYFRPKLMPSSTPVSSRLKKWGLLGKLCGSCWRFVLFETFCTGVPISILISF